MKKIKKLLIIIIVIIFIAGCGSSPIGKDMSLLIKEQEEWLKKSQNQEIILKSGDTIEVSFPYHQELSLNNAYSIPLDGFIQFPLIGTVKVAGKTVRQLRKELLEKYSKILKNPEVSIIIRNLADQRIFIGGEVKFPGLIVLSGRVTILQAIMQAGPLSSADLEDVYLIRLNPNKKREVYTINVITLMQDKTYRNLYLKGGDVIYIPKSGLSSTAEVFANIRQIVPYSFNLAP